MIDTINLISCLHALWVTQIPFRAAIFPWAAIHLARTLQSALATLQTPANGVWLFQARFSKLEGK